MTEQKKNVKQYLLILAVAILAFCGLVIFAWSKSNPIPEGGQTGPEADALAAKMLKAINHQAWQETGAVQWTFARGHKHLWDRHRQYARVQWDGQDVLIDLASKKGVVKSQGKQLEGQAAKPHLEKAWALWANDSFWLNPVSKVMDKGVTRRLVKDDQGKDALLVTYASGGVTPGDSYLWLLDNNHRPRAWRMWVSIIPIGGLEFSFDDWHQFETGVMLAPNHQGVISIDLKDIKTALTLGALLGDQPDPFEPLVKHLQK